MIHLGPKECLIPASGGNRDYYTKLVKALEKNNILVTERKKSNNYSMIIKLMIYYNYLTIYYFKDEFSIDPDCTDLNRLIKTTNDQNVANLGIIMTLLSFSKLYKYYNSNFDFSGAQK